MLEALYTFAETRVQNVYVQNVSVFTNSFSNSQLDKRLLLNEIAALFVPAVMKWLLAQTWTFFFFSF